MNQVPKTEPIKPVRLIDIAAKAGVSRTTVASVVLQSAGSSARVGKETAKRVLKVAKELGYRPNASAQRLAGKQTRIIGTIIDSHAPAPSFRQLAEIERHADEHGYRVMIGQSHGELKKIEAYAGDFIANGVDGVVCISHNYPQTGRRVAEIFRQIPNVVFIGRPLSGEEETNWIAVDHAAATRKLVQHFASVGRERIALIAPSDKYQSSRDRKRGYQEAIKEFSPSQEPLLLKWTPPEENEPITCWEPAASKHFLELHRKHKFDAILAINDIDALRLIRALEDAGLRVPDDVGVAGYDNLPLTDLTSPSVTTVDLRERDVARAAVGVLLSLVQNEPLELEQRRQSIEPNVIVRQSG